MTLEYQTMKGLGLWLESVINHPQWSVYTHHVEGIIESKTKEIVNSEDDVTHKCGVVCGMERLLAMPHDIISQFGSQGTVKEPIADLTKPEEE